MNLLPQPKTLEIKDGYLKSKKLAIFNECADERIAKAIECFEKADDGAVLTLKCGESDSEAYTLDIGGNGITIFGEGAKGLFYGIQTLKQIFENDAVPCLHIEDKPDMSYRGFYHDITRGRVPTVESVMWLIDKLAYYKMNSLQLYVEHTFPFKELGDSVEKFGHLTADEIRELDDYCYDNFIEFIPSIATFGHLYELLQREEYKELQCITDYKDKYHFWISRMRHHTIDPLNEKSFEVIKSLIDQYLPLFRTDKFNICCDETFDLKSGKHADKDTGELYIAFVKEIIEYLKSKGKKVMMWGDIVLQHPERLSELPADIEMLNWNYGENPPEKSFEVFENAGCTQIVCPGTGIWNRVIEGIDSSSKNICRMLDFGYKHGAVGMLNTNWGDWGHVCPIELAMHGLVLGAAKSWNKSTDKNDSFDESINALEYQNDNAVKYLTILDSANKKVKYSSLVIYYSNLFYEKFMDVVFPSEEDVKAVITVCKNVIAEVENENWERKEYKNAILVCAESLIVIAELLAKFAGYEIERGSDTSAWLKKYRASWLASNKESELREIEKMFVTLENK